MHSAGQDLQERMLSTGKCLLCLGLFVLESTHPPLLEVFIFKLLILGENLRSWKIFCQTLTSLKPL